MLVKEPVKPGLGDMLVSVGLIGFGCMAGARAAVAGDGAMAADMVRMKIDESRLALQGRPERRRRLGKMHDFSEDHKWWMADGRAAPTAEVRKTAVVL